jgi:4-amino-4-deoxy-L-arabinose transferase-like glycosyltransferase
MQEVPAFATGLLSVLLISKLPVQQRCMWIFASGIIMGVALQIKLTAALIIPATCLEIALNIVQRMNWKKRASLDILQWIGGLCLSFVLISLLFGAGSLQMSWRAHTGGLAAQTLEAGVGRAEDFTLKASTFVDHIECVSGAVLAIGMAISKRRLRQIAFPLVLLITALSVHLVHRPWWMYYYLHFAIPLSWLAGLAIGDVIQASNSGSVNEIVM